jgi:UDP-N-acetylmuramoyl-tripeptide--D-alanyl-D-alanine ligase
VPLSLARLPRSARYGVFELGMNHAGEIRSLAAMVRPHVALVTAIAPAHLEMLGSVEAIAAAKAEIFEGLEPAGVAVLPRDSEHYRLLADRAVACGARIVSFGAHRDADWRLLDAQLGASGSTVEVAHDGRPLRFRLASAGRHAVLNSLAVLACVAELGADAHRAAAELAALQPTAGRGARRRLAVRGGEAVLLDESYNANPASMAAAIQVLGSQPGRRVAALGDMLELGPEGPALHAALARELAAAEVDLVFTCGPVMRHLHAILPARTRGGHFESSAELAKALGRAVQQGDVVLVKGSLGSRMRVVVDQLLAASAESAALARWA